ncbi:Cobalamin B12-binding domain protein [Desulfamplus magnetovallimortis]|uniref:Cobalamin B12-binding domain protein n=1 Tax=Desulfamplus magnetovallimortis TaxID=1246637 RepID=A0A1W1HL84_9BACT|nr:cobalamin-dependent protein [Desulfamplus magnetovallimortis]SLM33223.1 Cobalamin B12-binding domain protein [Desulfamplus magnetovallimortis]
MEKLIENFVQSLLSLDRLSAKKMLEDFTSAPKITFIESVVIPALEKIGKGWQEGEFALSQVYMAGRICEDLVYEILPSGSPERKDQPKMAICVLSDQHKLGKTIVYSLLRASGFDLLDYGTMEVDDLVVNVRQDGIKVLLISVLMLPSALKIRQLKEKLVSLDLDVKIVVGGAPFRFDNKLWQEVGADAMCANASEAVSVIRSISGGVE